MRKFLWLVLGFWLGGRLLSAGAETYSLADGTSLTGDVVKCDDSGVMIRTPDDVYTNLTWTRFSQDGLKQLEQNPKCRLYVQPFIIPPPAERTKRVEVTVQPVSRLELPPRESLLGAMFSSSVGLVVLLLIYAANLWAAKEVADFRSRPPGLVVGVAAVLPILGPIIFLSLPGRAEPVPEMVEELGSAPQAAAPGGAPASASAAATRPPAASIPMPAQSSGLHVATTTREPPAEGDLPETQIFQRGQYMFNRRFFETKFPGFFGIIRREADKNLLLLVKTPRGRFDVQRISRIAANDVHFEIPHGPGRQEVMVPYAEIQEIQLKHKDA